MNRYLLTDALELGGTELFLQVRSFGERQPQVVALLSSLPFLLGGVMRIYKKYLEQAEKLRESNFDVYGIGHFSVSIEDIAYILFLLNNRRWGDLADFYKRLHSGVFE